MPSSVRYQKLGRSYTSTEGEVYTELQFAKSEPKVPWRANRIAVVLFSIGSVLIIVGSLLLAGYFDKEYRLDVFTKKNSFDLKHFISLFT